MARMEIRRARIEDSEGICSLVNGHAERGSMLHRSLESVYEAIREVHVADRGGRLVGCVAVDVFWSDLAEVKSLAVAPPMQGRGVGRKLLTAAVADARRLGIGRLFALTYEESFFKAAGFETVDRDTLPEKVWRECIGCPKADRCDEIALMLLLEDDPAR